MNAGTLSLLLVGWLAGRAVDVLVVELRLWFHLRRHRRSAVEQWLQMETAAGMQAMAADAERGERHPLPRDRRRRS